MDTAALVRFARRDWSASTDAKLKYWVEQYRRHGGGPARAASTALLQHMRRVQPSYPSESDRADDLADHLRLRERLDRAARAFTRR